MRHHTGRNDWLVPQAGLAALRGDALRSSDSEAPPSVQGALGRSGIPLDAGVRSEVEKRTGRDFSGVRVHTDELAAGSARDIGALAYTVGQQVVFGRGRYAPGSAEGRGLLLHELAHVDQQRGASAHGANLGISSAGESQARHAQNHGLSKVQPQACAPGVQRAPDPDSVAEFNRQIEDIKLLDKFKTLDSKHQKMFTRIVDRVRDSERRLYFADRLRVLFTTEEAPASKNSEILSGKIRNAALDEAQRLSSPGAPSATREEHVSTQRLESGALRPQTITYNGKPVAFEIDASDPADIAVRVKVHLRPSGHGTQTDVENVEALEDAVEKRASTGGYSFDVVFVKTIKRNENDVFDIPVDTAQWTSSGNFVGDAISIAHELHHVLGLDQDRYDYIESHSKNPFMKVRTRLELFEDEFKKNIPNDRDSIMYSADRVPLDDDICRLAAPGDPEDKNELRIKACAAERRQAREKQLKPGVDLAQVLLKQAMARPQASSDAIARTIFTAAPSASRRSEILKLIPGLIQTWNMLPHSELDPDCRSGHLAFAHVGVDRQFRYCPLYLSAAPGFQANALIVEALHLVNVGDFDQPECPTGSGCTGPCGDAANAKAWARFIQCSAGT